MKIQDINKMYEKSFEDFRSILKRAKEEYTKAEDVNDTDDYIEIDNKILEDIVFILGDLGIYN